MCSYQGEWGAVYGRETCLVVQANLMKGFGLHVARKSEAYGRGSQASIFQ
jgi:hypothetical protein